MTRAPLAEKVRSPGYTPPLRELEPLFALLARADDDDAKHVERALSRLGAAAAREATARFPDSSPPLRGRLCSLAGRVAQSANDAALVEWLVARLGDSDPRTRRRAARALGKLGGPSVEAALVAALEQASELPDSRAFALALGNVGGERALERLVAVRATDPELSRIVGEAETKVRRGLARPAASTLDPLVPPPGPVPVLLHVRAGIEELTLEELDTVPSARISGRGRVALELDVPLAELYSARTFLHLGFPLEPVTVHGGDVACAVVTAITSPEAWRIFSWLTKGSVRYRLAWATGGRRRALVYRIAREAAERRPELHNDPIDAPWEVVVTDRSDKTGGRIFVELWPRGVTDPRFAYRRHALVASSHPTIAAALARAGGARPGDVVWDPFAGSAMELIERARLGPYDALYATDTDAAALARARENVEAAEVARCEFHVGDARAFRLPVAPSLVLTNPPYGKRLVTRVPLDELLEATLANAAEQLRPGGRFAWISPHPRFTAEAAKRRGLAAASRRPVDVGGVPAELQVFEKGLGPRPRR